MRKNILDRDFNGDLKPDVTAPNSNSANVSVLLGNGMGGFAAANNFPDVGGPFAVAVGDFNGDGMPDLALSNAGATNFSVLLQKCQ